MTEYVILRGVPSTLAWEVAANIEGRSARSVIRQYLEDTMDDSGDGSFVAVPARSWKPVTVSVETKTLLRFD